MSWIAQHPGFPLALAACIGWCLCAWYVLRGTRTQRTPLELELEDTLRRTDLLLSSRLEAGLVDDLETRARCFARVTHAWAVGAPLTRSRTQSDTTACGKHRSR